MVVKVRVFSKSNTLFTARWVTAEVPKNFLQIWSIRERFYKKSELRRVASPSWRSRGTRVGWVSVMDLRRWNITTLDESLVLVFGVFGVKRDRHTGSDSCLSLFIASFMRSLTLSGLFRLLYQSQS